ncbi:MAG: anti-sigma 24 factor [Rhodocyclaceae bacterium]|nr:anti-sigma 24 factor [Rhodocyclaceae bacterium]
MSEQVSAVLDGDVDADALARLVARLGSDSELRERWDTYCLIGDAMRGDAAAPSGLVTGVMAALETEPTILAPARTEASDGAGWSQRVLPIAASVMGVAVVGWMAMTLGNDREAAPSAVQSVARISQPESRPVQPVASRQAIDPHREYVFIHQASSRNSPLPGVAQYVRSVSEVQGVGR